MSGREIEIEADDGGRFAAYLAPPPAAPAPGLLVLPEIYNANDHIRAVADRFAGEGFLALAPDIYWRIEPGLFLSYTAEGRARARALNRRLDVDRLVEDLGACLAALKGHADCTGRVGCVGFCLGGKLTYLCAARLAVDAAVSYYGVGIDRYLDETDNIACPMILHFAGNDDHVTPAAVAAIRDRLAARPEIGIHLYPGAEHAFNRFAHPPYHEASARRAWRRTLALFERVLREETVLD